MKRSLLFHSYLPLKLLALIFAIFFSCKNHSEPPQIFQEDKTVQIHPISSSINNNINSIEYIYPGNVFHTVESKAIEYLYSGNDFQTVKSNYYLIPGVNWESIKKFEVYLVKSSNTSTAEYPIPGYGEKKHSQYFVLKGKEGIEVSCDYLCPGEPYTSVRLVLHTY